MAGVGQYLSVHETVSDRIDRGQAHMGSLKEV
jgi:hypothetical protein